MALRSGIAFHSTLLSVSLAAFSLAPKVVSAANNKSVPMPVFHSVLPASLRTPDFILTKTDDGVPVTQGRDKTGKPWRLTTPLSIRGLWNAETHGVRTYYFVGYTGGSDMAPATWILALSFDEQGKPVPFFVRS